MISKKFLAAATIGLFVALPLTAQTGSAQGMGGHDHGAMSGMHAGHSPFLMLLKSANLTPAQQSQVHLILNSNRMQMMSLHHQLEKLHQQIADKLLSSGAVTSADLKPLVDKASSMEAKLNQNMADTAVSIRNVLTAAQVAKLAEVHNKLRSLHEQVQNLMGSKNGAPDDDADN